MSNINRPWITIFKRITRATPPKMLIVGFLFLIILGAFMLSLPISSISGERISFTNALFTATSAVCVTGLVVVDTNMHWTFFGKAIILLLIQIGALGIMSVVTLFSVITGRQLGLTHRLAIKESISIFSMHDISSSFQKILLTTLSIEGIGAALIAGTLIPKYGFAEGSAKSVFHSISAFCNAGFDLFGSADATFVSVTGFQNNPYMLIITALLIIIGGLGFIVWNDLAVNRKFEKLTLHTKVVLLVTASLLLVGTIGFYVFESNDTMKNMPFWEKVVNAFFQSVTTRTAGFNALPVGEMHDTSGLLTILLMAVGAAPGSTGGGMKVTTLFVLVTSTVAFIGRRTEVYIFKRRIAAAIITKAVTVLMLSASLIFLTTFVLMMNNEGSFMQVLYEAVSAFGTVGLSTGITPHLQTSSKFMIILTMFFGRIGAISIFMTFASMNEPSKTNFRYPEGIITLG